MSLRCVGLCGVDDTVDPSLLSAIGSKWPRAELGVLIRPGKEGTPRYPTRQWLEKFAKAARRTSPPVRMAAHLCGSACDAVLRGDFSFVIGTLVPWGFRRVQLNATASNGCAIDSAGLATAAQTVRAACNAIPEVEWIIQANEETKVLWEAIVALGDARPSNVAVLWDASCGQGVTLDASTCPAPSPGLLAGYAGGITPANVAAVVASLRAGVAKGTSIWIDMESGLRSQYAGDLSERFDVHKAWAVCAALDEANWDEAGAAVSPALVAEVPLNAKMSGHAVLAHKVTLLRDRRTKPREFRTILSELTTHLGYELTACLKVVPRHDCVTPLGIAVAATAGQATRLAVKCAIVPVMRAGLGMVDAMLEILPNAEVHQIGMFKGGASYHARPIEYYSRLPKRGGQACDLAIVLDPCVATARTVHAVIDKLKAWGAKKVVVLCVLASQDGLKALHAAHPDVDIHVAQVDQVLTASGELVPGLGDAGDRLFGAPTGSKSFEEYDEDDVYESPLTDMLAPASPATPAVQRVGGFAVMALALPERRRQDDEPSTSVLGPSSEAYPVIEPPDVIAAEEAGVVTQLTTHDGSFGPAPLAMAWGAPGAARRGPVLATTRHQHQRNAIGAHAGGDSVYRALAVVSGTVDNSQLPKLGLTTPAARIGPYPAWADAESIVTMDPWGHAISEGFAPWLKKGFDIRPTIAVTKAHVELPECKEAMREGRLKADGVVLNESGTSVVTKAAIEPVWFLPGVARRFGVDERTLREALFAETNSMYPELITRMDLKLFLPPIGGMTVYVWGDVSTLSDESVELTCRVHDECNGSDVFGSDICTCRPYLTHAIEECIKCAQRGGNGVVVYFRKEGRALGEVTKYLVYNMRKRQEGGDRASEYFNCTQSVAGVTDTRFQALMPDVLHWLGIKRIHRFISMSDMKYDAIVKSGIRIDERVEIPPEMVPKDAQVEIAAKVFLGYHGGKSYTGITEQSLEGVVGREYKPDDTAVAK
mmetsp:Transcript_23603/g.84238  ORF Transcript_23603/g.84238 Transcript_23603/m.84238 type:complete len:993 (+) Transcript_23603:109-3087(+)